MPVPCWERESQLWKARKVWSRLGKVPIKITSPSKITINAMKFWSLWQGFIQGKLFLLMSAMEWLIIFCHLPSPQKQTTWGKIYGYMSSPCKIPMESFMATRVHRSLGMIWIEGGETLHLSCIHSPIKLRNITKIWDQRVTRSSLWSICMAIRENKVHFFMGVAIWAITWNITR